MMYTLHAYKNTKCATMPLSISSTDSLSTATFVAKQMAEDYGYCVLKNNVFGYRQYFYKP